MTWVVEQTANNSNSVSAFAIAATFATTPVEGNEMLALVASRPGDNSENPPTNHVSSQGGATWDEIATAASTSHRLSIFHRTAGPSEPTVVGIDPSGFLDDAYRMSIALMEISGPPFGTPVALVEDNSAGASVVSFPGVFTLPSQPQFVVALASIRQNGTNENTDWSSSLAPANEPWAVGALDVQVFCLHAGWEEIADTTEHTWQIQLITTLTGSQAVMVIAGWPEASAAPIDPPTLLTPADDETTDLEDGETFTWDHAGEGAQTDFAFKRRALTNGEWEWWNGTGWQSTEVFISSATESVEIPSGDW